ncbi:MAG: Ig-like domain-containing protein, partial [Actinobacteria bacterium]|nr:Ig-like domain-containing protein [Actinomycetota bacterium]
SGNYSLEFNAIGVTDNALSDLFDVLPAAASSINPVSGNNQSGVVTESLSAPFVVRVSDSFGNPVQNETVEFEITNTPAGASGDALSQEIVQTDASGEASSILTLGAIAGSYTVSVALSGVGSVSFTANADPGAVDSFVFNTIASPQTAGQPFSITIETQDEFENRATGYSGSPGLSTTAGTITPSTATFSSGQVTLDVTVSEAGTDQSITATDGTVTGTSNAFDVQSGSVDADNSTVNASPANLQAGSTSTVTVDLRDGSNNPVSGLTETDFTIGLTGSATAGTISETATDGTYSFAVNNTVAESVTVTVAADGVTLTNSPSITFTAADAVSLDIQSGNNQTGTVSEALADPFVVQITDQYGNPLAAETVDFAIDQVPVGANGQSVSQASVLTDAAGEAFTLLTLGDTPGTYTVDASSGSLTVVTFSAEAEIGAASQMTISVQPSETTAGEVIAPAPAVEVTDNIGNPVAGIDVTVSEQGGYTFDAGPLTVSTDASGMASFGDLVIQ